MRAKEFISEEQKLDEVLPLLVGAARLAGGAVGLAARGAAAVGGAALRGAASVGKAVAGTAVQGVKGAVNAVTPTGPQPPNPPKTQQDVIADKAKDQLLRPGAKLKLPTAGPTGLQDFKVTRVQGDNVEIENPNAKNNPNEPAKLVYKKSDIKQNLNL